MNPAAVNPTNLFSTPAPANRGSAQGAPEAGFNQMLTREIASRKPEMQTKPPVNDAAPARQSEPAKPPADTQKTADNKVARPTDGTGKKQDQPETRDASETDDADTTEAKLAAQVSTDMLALVANASQTIQTTVPDAAAAAAVADEGGLLRAAGGRRALATDDALLLAGTQKPGTGIEADADAGVGTFAARIADAAAGRVQQQTTLTEAELRAAPQAAGLALKGELAASDAQPGSVAALTGQQSLAQTQAAAQAGDKLSARVGTPAWDQAVGQKVVWMASGAQQTASLTLNPPELGPLQIVLNVNNSQASATFIAAQPEVRQALEAAMPRLREMMEEAGIQLGQASVNAGTPGQGNGFGEQPRSAQRNPQVSADDSLVASTSTVTAPVTSSGRGMVDTFA